MQFPISRDPPEGGTTLCTSSSSSVPGWFPISRDPPEGGTYVLLVYAPTRPPYMFPISRDPPEGGTAPANLPLSRSPKFPISRDPPEGGTIKRCTRPEQVVKLFPISRDPPEGGTIKGGHYERVQVRVSNF